MENINKTLLKNLNEFGLTEEQSLLYLLLQQHPQSSSYKLHQLSEVSRGKVENILKELLQKQLITENKALNKQKTYIAHPFKNLTNLIELKTQETDQMKEALNSLLENSQFAMFKKSSETYHYTGIDGLKQVLWNSLKTKGEMYVFEVSRLSAFMQQSFAESWRQEVLQRGFTIKDLTNQNYMAGWTDVPGFVEINPVRYVDPKVLEILYEIYIYNDVVVMLEYKDKEIMCTEIHNKYLANLQKQLFEYIWKDAAKMDVIGDRGEMKVVE
jgi:sugar-specific transcriptional regulator TrmB